MKTVLLTLPFLLMSLMLTGQQMSMGMRYQAVVRDADGHLIVNEPVTVRIEMVTMDGSPQVY